MIPIINTRMMERVFDFGGDVEKVFPSYSSTKREDSRMSPAEGKGLSQSSSVDSLEHLESGYNSVDSQDQTTCPARDTTSRDTSSGDSGQDSQQDSLEESFNSNCDDTAMIMAGRNLVCISTPIRDVSFIRLLDLSYNSLQMLTGIHIYNKVEELILDNNGVTQLSLPPMVNLSSLSVNNNNLDDLQKTLLNLEIAAPHLTYLSMLCNPLCPNELMAGDEDDYQMYRYLVISRLKNLKFLDSRPVTSQERVDSERYKSFNGIVRATDQNFKEEKLFCCRGTPLKEAKPLKPNHKRTSVAGKLRKRYVGKNSEGNRFIGNESL